MEPISQNFNIPQEVSTYSPMHKNNATVEKTAAKIDEMAKGMESLNVSNAAKTPMPIQKKVEEIPTVFQSTLNSWIKDKTITPEEGDMILSKLESVYNKPFPKITPSPNKMHQRLSHHSKAANSKEVTPSFDQKKEETTNSNSLPDGESKVTLLRGCRPDQLLTMLRYGSAGNVPANKDATAPDEKECKLQVGEAISLPEFTYDEKKANAFGTGSFVCAVKIAYKYLGKGSVAEDGEIAHPDAPLEVIAVQRGRTFEGGVIPKAIASNTGSALRPGFRGGLTMQRARSIKMPPSTSTKNAKSENH